jgi:hypothetical protein
VVSSSVAVSLFAHFLSTTTSFSVSYSSSRQGRPFKKSKTKTKPKQKDSSAIVPGLSLAVDMARDGVAIPVTVSSISDDSSKQDYTN